MENKYPIKLRLWFWWVTLTVIYVPFYLLALRFDNKFVGHIAGKIGLFVPFGIWNTTMALDIENATLPNTHWILRILTIPFALILIFTADKLAIKFNIRHSQIKILFNLFILMVITFVIDIVLWQEWTSWYLFTNGVEPFKF